MNILGISALYHDSACGLIQNGKLINAAQEERFSRIKYDASIPKEAARFCLSHAGLSIKDVDVIAYYEKPQRKLSRQLWMLSQGLPFDEDLLSRLDSQRPENEIREILGYDGSIEFVDHHTAHAASSYYFSGFSESAIFTVDSVGEWASSTFGYGKGADIKIVEEIHFPHSFGLLYSTVTSYLGFDVNDGEYKVMGLAPYGKPVYTKQIWKLIQEHHDNQLQLHLDYFDFIAGQRMFSNRFIDLFERAPRLEHEKIESFHKNVACSLQAVLGELLLEKARYLHTHFPSENLCMAGGVALNCVANGHILREGPFTNIFVQPAAGDAGGAIGAAAFVHSKHHHVDHKPDKMEHAFWGPSYPSHLIFSLLQSMPLEFEDYRNRFDDLCNAVSKRLAEGQIIGWFQDRMEFGPRALGARSILADPRRHEMRDKINALVKKREAFRPFAPAVLAEKCHEHFDLTCPSPFMLLVCQVCSPLELPAVTHVDGSARVQTVSEENNPRFAALLRQFEKISGCPVLLNTSFNMKDEPIVCHPLEAIRCFVRSKMDALVLQDFVIDQKTVPTYWYDLAELFHQSEKANINHSVYTFF